MKKSKICVWILPFLLLFQYGKAQDGGLQFEKGNSWKNITEKAKAENKFCRILIIIIF